MLEASQTFLSAVDVRIGAGKFCHPQAPMSGRIRDFNCFFRFIPSIYIITPPRAPQERFNILRFREMEHEVVEKRSMNQADQYSEVHNHTEPASQPKSEVVDTKLSPVPAENGYAPVSNPHHNQPTQVTSENHDLAPDLQPSSEIKSSTLSGYSEEDSRERGLATEAISQQPAPELVTPPDLGTTEDPHIDQANQTEPNGLYEFPNHQGITNLEVSHAIPHAFGTWAYLTTL